jgi:hypothetical protein
LTPLLLLAALSATAVAAPPPGRLEAELKSWVQARIGRAGASEARFAPALVDLNGDSAPEALVYVSGRDWCGSGGCNLYILSRNSGRWRLINSVTITNPPIRLLKTRRRGWNDIAVRVQGGGVGPPFEAVLRFDGARYPGNPTVAPAVRARQGSPGRVLIGSDADAKPLFP